MIQRGTLLSRAAALGLLLLAAVLIWMALIEPLLTAVTGSSSEEQEKSLQLLARYESAISQKAALDAQLKALGDAADDHTGLVLGPTSAVAAASLQGELRTLIESVSGEIRSAQILPAEKIDDFEKIAIQYELSLPQSSLQRLLQSLETHRTVLIVDAVRVRVPETLRSIDAGGPDARISGQWVIAGFRRADTNAR
jgi:hypothetical protein